MIAETGHFALILALAVALFQFAMPLYGAQRGDAAVMRMAAPAALVQFILIFTAFAALTHAYVTSDFSVQNVFENSHSAKPLLYKLSGVWGNHEGSMVLWVMILAIRRPRCLFGNNCTSNSVARFAVRFRRRCLPSLHRHHIQSLRPPRSAPLKKRAQRSQDPASPSIAFLCRLCRARRFLRRCRVDRGQGGCGLGPLGAALDACRLDVPHHRHQHGKLVGLL
jgi:hypothetical protein